MLRMCVDVGMQDSIGICSSGFVRERDVMVLA